MPVRDKNRESLSDTFGQKSKTITPYKIITLKKSKTNVPQKLIIKNKNSKIEVSQNRGNFSADSQWHWSSVL